MTLSQAIQLSQERPSVRHESTCSADSLSLCQKVEPCILPTLASPAKAPQPLKPPPPSRQELRHVNIVDAISTLESSALRSFCILHKLSLEALVASSWALFLREYAAWEAATFGEVVDPFNAVASKSTDPQTVPSLRVWHCRLDGALRVKDFLAGLDAGHSPCSTKCRLYSLYNTAICLQRRADFRGLEDLEYLHDKVGLTPTIGFQGADILKRSGS